jgi:hypothetical protein
MSNETMHDIIKETRLGYDMGVHSAERAITTMFGVLDTCPNDRDKTFGMATALAYLKFKIEVVSRRDKNLRVVIDELSKAFTAAHDAREAKETASG